MGKSKREGLRVDFDRRLKIEFHDSKVTPGECRFMEFDNPRAGNFEPLRFVPMGKTIVLGIVNSKFPELESKDEFKRRVEEASKYVPLDQLALSPQCGFASTLLGNKLTVQDGKAKLRLVVETAEEIWG